MPLLRLDKIISDMGFASLRDVKSLVKNGRVLIDGSVAASPDAKYDTALVRITVDGEAVLYRQFRYIMMNKPDGLICATEDKHERTVLELLDERTKRQELFTVGRLDKDTEGLLLLTNDGELTHMLLSPKKHVPKTYLAKIMGRVSEQDVEAFKMGVTLEDGYKTMASQLEILEGGIISLVEVTIYEGKFHQVKRMFQAVGKEVIYLKRISMGELKLDETLKPGDFRELNEKERKIIGIE
jgi:16S rRNA pseudouridine516 synthase